MSGRGLHVSPSVYRARRRFVAAIGATLLALTGTAAYRVVSARGGPDEAAASDVGAVVAGSRPVVTPVGPGPTRPPAGSTPAPPAGARSAPRPGTAAPAPRPGTTTPVPRIVPAAVPATHPSTVTTARPDAPALPSSGTGRRIFYSIGHQRVWLVSDADRVARTYRVSGARTEYVSPGTFHVYSRSTLAVA